MPKPADRLATNAPGDWYVDRSCIDCGTCRRIAPETFARRGSQSAVVAQPKEPAAVLRAGMALLACPVGAIGAPSRTDLREARDRFPEDVCEGVLDVGYACRQAGGAAAWLLLRPEGNVLVDVPRYAKPLLAKVEALGGVAYIVVTHPRRAGQHRAWAKRFGARCVGAGPTPEGAAVETAPPGRSTLTADLELVAAGAGHLAVRWREEVLCAGGLLQVDADGELVIPRETALQAELLRGLAFGRVLPAHGRPWSGEGAATLRGLLQRLAPA